MVLASLAPALHQLVQSRQRGVMPNKDRPQVERHPPKQGVGWLLNDQQGSNDEPEAWTV